MAFGREDAVTIAELHGKLSPKRAGGFYERMEDLLTSDVFGTMKYAGWEYGFLDWLRSARRAKDNSICATAVFPSDEEVSHAEYKFWPLLQNGREPDLLIALHQKSGKLALVMVEAKYLSGPSNIEVEGEFTPAEITGDQLADQINGFPNTFSENSQTAISSRIHIYLTAHHSWPMETFQASSEKIRRNDVNYFWLDWQSLAAFLEQKIQAAEGRPKLLLQDLLDLLTRKGLVPFKGFRLDYFESISLYPERGFWKGKWWQVGIVPHVHDMKGFWREP